MPSVGNRVQLLGGEEQNAGQKGVEDKKRLSDEHCLGKVHWCCGEVKLKVLEDGKRL